MVMMFQTYTTFSSVEYKDDFFVYKLAIVSYKVRISRYKPIILIFFPSELQFIKSQLRVKNLQLWLFIAIANLHLRILFLKIVWYKLAFAHLFKRAITLFIFYSVAEMGFHSFLS